MSSDDPNSFRSRLQSAENAAQQAIKSAARQATAAAEAKAREAAIKRTQDLNQCYDLGTKYGSDPTLIPSIQSSILALAAKPENVGMTHIDITNHALAFASAQVGTPLHRCRRDGNGGTWFCSRAVEREWYSFLTAAVKALNNSFPREAQLNAEIQSYYCSVTDPNGETSNYGTRRDVVISHNGKGLFIQYKGFNPSLSRPFFTTPQPSRTPLKWWQWFLR